MCAHFCYKIVRCGIFVWYIMGFCEVGLLDSNTNQICFSDIWDFKHGYIRLIDKSLLDMVVES